MPRETANEGRTEACDPGPLSDWLGYSLGNFSELILGCLDIAGAKAVAEIGSEDGFFTRTLLEWAASRGATVTAIDPEPQPALRALARRRPALRLVERTSGEAIPELPAHDAVIVDGDHNYFTVSEELRLISDRAEGRLPLLFFHDVAWPHGRRDRYADPDRIPREYRQPLAANCALHPDEPGVADHGIRYRWAAAREGGARNGVRTALEDYVAERGNLRLAIVPVFFGLGVVWDVGSSWGAELATFLGPWDRDPILTRLESNRIAHLMSAIAANDELEGISGLLHAEHRARVDRDNILRTMLGSRAFAVGERLSRLRHRGHAALSRERIHAVLTNGDLPSPDAATSSSSGAEPAGEHGEPLLHVDYPGRRPGEVHVTPLEVQGWAWSNRGIERVLVRVDDEPEHEAFLGVRRPDVASELGIPDATQAGFTCPLGTDVLPPGWHRLRVLATTPDGVAAERSVEIRTRRWADQPPGEPASRADAPHPEVAPPEQNGGDPVFDRLVEVEADLALAHYDLNEARAQAHHAMKRAALAERGLRALEEQRGPSPGSRSRRINTRLRKLARALRR